MAVKPGAGETVKQTTYTEVIPSNEPTERGSRLPELWDLVETLAPTTDPSNPDYQFTIYRGTKAQRAEEKEWLGKFHERMTREKIQSMFGGGSFNIWLKMRVGKGNALELKYNEDLKIGGEPRISAVASNGTHAPLSNEPLTRLIDVMDRRLAQMEAKLENATGAGAATKAVEQAVSLTGQVFSAATTAASGTLARIADPGHGGAPANDPMRELQAQLMQAMIAKLLNPTDPIETFAKMAAAVKALPGFNGGDSKAGIALELVRQIPNVTHNLVQGLQAWQMGVEAQARHAAILRGAAPAIPVTPVAPAVAAVPTAPAAAAGPAAPPPAPPVQVEVPQMPIETLEQMLCNIIADERLSLEEAATEACALIERSMPGMTDTMISRGEEWLLSLFNTRPVLQQVANHPRLPEFVKKFIETVKAAPIMQPANPSAPVA